MAKSKEFFQPLRPNGYEGLLTILQLGYSWTETEENTSNVPTPAKLPETQTQTEPLVQDHRFLIDKKK